MYHLVADSGCDIFTLGDTSFKTVPLTINSNDKSFTDDADLSTAEMIEFFLSYKGKSSTACPSTAAWLDSFITADGSVPEEIYVVTLTSSLSGTYNSALVAKDIFLEKHSDTKILVIDSLSVGPEMWLILEKIDSMKKMGKSFEEVSAEINNYVDKVRLFFAFKSLHNLAENGRVSKLAASAAGLLGISVYGTASNHGTIEPIGKVRGNSKVISCILKEMKAAGYSGGKVRISQTENEALAALVRDEILKEYPNTDIKITAVRGLCAFYCERGGIVVSCET